MANPTPPHTTTPNHIPGVLLNVADADALGGVNGEDPSEQVLAIRREHVQIHSRELPLLLLGQRGQLLLQDVVHRGDAVGVVVRAVEREGAKEHREQEHAARPHVCPLGVVPVRVEKTPTHTTKINRNRKRKRTETILSS